MSADGDGRHRRPVILAVDDEPAVLAAVARNLRKGFGERFRIMRPASGPEALELLAEIRTRGEEVALLVAGLESTLTLLGHKLKHTSIAVERDYDRDLPRLAVHGSELNQVWTNLLDNAIDALGERGRITIITRRNGPCVRVDVADDGPGIPDGVRDRIHDPFFTTKDVGAGTGLGLDTARRSVHDRHHGTLGVDSRPGRTVFHVWLPVSAG